MDARNTVFAVDRMNTSSQSTSRPHKHVIMSPLAFSPGASLSPFPFPVFSLLCFPLDPLSFPLDPDRQSLRPASCAASWRHGGAARSRAPPLKEQCGGCGEPPREARRRLREPRLRRSPPAAAESSVEYFFCFCFCFSFLIFGCRFFYKTFYPNLFFSLDLDVKVFLQFFF